MKQFLIHISKYSEMKIENIITSHLKCDILVSIKKSKSVICIL
ncbi:hypothetical protein HMPREF9089_00314 [Eubacterium brachy ATCC 33089]|nr:hypothetical protein HMPREF9089_00314 [Eubacterium brachy ATCC 33089]